MNVKLETFEGPLDLLLHLIQKAEVDIYDIPVSQITEQYLLYLDSLQEAQLEVASEFLVMAATLLEIKSRMLLPKPPKLEEEYPYEDEVDPRQELVERLLEYKKYKELAETLRDKEMERSLLYTREKTDLTPYLPMEKPNPVEGLTVVDLIHAFQRTLRKMRKEASFAKIRRDEISVSDRMTEVLELLQTQQGKCLFSQLFVDSFSREELVVTFLALLELMKVKSIVCYQHALFEEIVIERISWTREGEGESA